MFAHPFCKISPTSSFRINKHHGVIVTVREQVKTVELGRLCIVYGIGRNKATYFRIVVARLQIVELGFDVIVITTVAERVQVAYEGRRRHFDQGIGIIYFVVTPRVVVVERDGYSRGIDYCKNIALQILLVEVRFPLVREAHNTRMVVHKMQAVALFDQIVLAIVGKINTVFTTSVAKSVVSKRISSKLGKISTLPLYRFISPLCKLVVYECARLSVEITNIKELS